MSSVQMITLGAKHGTLTSSRIGSSGGEQNESNFVPPKRGDRPSRTVRTSVSPLGAADSACDVRAIPSRVSPPEQDRLGDLGGGRAGKTRSDECIEWLRTAPPVFSFLSVALPRVLLVRWLSSRLTVLTMVGVSRNTDGYRLTSSNRPRIASLRSSEWAPAHRKLSPTRIRLIRHELPRRSDSRKVEPKPLSSRPLSGPR